MNDSSIIPVSIEDSRISDITDKEIFGVHSSASQSTYQQYQANTQTNSSITFNCQIPSENIVIDREIKIQSTVTFTIQATNVPPGEEVFNWGSNFSFQAFPLNGLFTTTQCTINNASTSTNLMDIKDIVLRMMDRRSLNKLNSMTPSLPDCGFGLYIEGVDTNQNPLATFNNVSYDEAYVPRGSFPLNYFNVVHTSPGEPNDNSLRSVALGDTWTVTIQATFTEPFICLSPFINSDSNNKAGMLGVNTMSFNLLIDSACKRAFSYAGSVDAANNLITSPITSITLGGTVNGMAVNAFTNSRLLFNFLSLQPDQYAKLSTKNILPYSDFPRFLTSYNNNSVVAPYTDIKITTQSIQLSQIPDKIFIAARIPMSQQNWTNSSSFLAIKNVSVNFNNSSGLLSSCATQDLFTISKKNGYQGTYYEWGGVCNSTNATNFNPNNGQVATTGSILVLDPVYDFSLPSYLSAGSLGQYQLQMNIQVYNQFPINITPEIIIITQNSGFFCLQTGTASIFTGVLTKETVLNSKESNPVSHIDSDSLDRMVGGNLLDRGASSMGKLVHHFKKHILPNLPAAAALVSEMSGSGSSGAGFSGAGRRIGKHLR